MISTQDKQRTNLPNGEWPRCREVTLRDGVLHCELDFARTYVLVGAYKRDLHIEFANANTDRQLIDFTTTWGPTFLNPTTPGIMDFNFTGYRNAQQRFNALIGLLNAFKKCEQEREELLRFISAERKIACSLPIPPEPEMFTRYWCLKDEFHIEGSVADWVERANLQTIRLATDFLIPKILTGPSVQLVGRRTRKQRLLEADWNIYDLGRALEWMIWFDEFTQHPVVCCQECRKVFRGETARVRKYCSTDCGHRATARVAMRKRRAAERVKGK